MTAFVRGNKNDGNDTVAIYEASFRPHIRFVPIKTEAQQEILLLHRLRERLLSTRTAATNQLRGLLAVFGIIFPLGKASFIEKRKHYHLIVRYLLGFLGSLTIFMTNIRL